MSAPEGYTELATLSYSYKGEYSADSTYNKYNTVYSEGSTYVSLQDDNTGHKPSNDGVWWKYVARGFLTEDASEIEATDTYGITDDTPTPAGGLTKKSILQTWLDKAANRIVNKLVANDNFQAKLMEFLVNNGTTNLEGYGLDARFGKTLQDQVSELNAKTVRVSVNDSSDFSSFKYYINENDYYEYIFSSADVVYRKYINGAEIGIWRIAGDEY